MKLLLHPTSLTVATNGAILGIGLVNAVLLARWLAPQGRGEVAAVLLWPTLLVYIGSFGMISGVVYFAALPDARQSAILGTSLSLAAIQGAILGMIGYIAMPLALHSQSHQIVQISRVTLVIIPLSLASQYLASILQAHLAFRRMNVLRLVLPAGYLVCTVVLHVDRRLDAATVAGAQIALNAIVLVGSMLVLSRIIPLRSARFAFSTAKQLLVYGAQAFLGSIASQMNARLDQTLLAAWVPSTPLGLYVAAVSASNVLQSIPLAIRIVATPHITRQATIVDRTQRLKREFRLFLITTLLLAVPLAILLPWLIPFLYGPSFRGAVVSAEILLVGAVFTGATSVLTGGTQALGRPWLGSKAQVIGLIATVALLFTLVPLIGIVGAAIASTVAYAITAIVLVRGVQHVFGVTAASLFRIDLDTMNEFTGFIKGALTK